MKYTEIIEGKDITVDLQLSMYEINLLRKSLGYITGAANLNEEKYNEYMDLFDKLGDIRNSKAKDFRD